MSSLVAASKYMAAATYLSGCHSKIRLSAVKYTIILRPSDSFWVIIIRKCMLKLDLSTHNSKLSRFTKISWKCFKNKKKTTFRLDIWIGLNFVIISITMFIYLIMNSTIILSFFIWVFWGHLIDLSLPFNNVNMANVYIGRVS